MADAKISALTAVTTPAVADEFAVNQSGTSKKETLKQILRGVSQELTASGAVTAGVQAVELNHATVVIAATIAAIVGAHEGLFVVKNTSASGTAAHTLTLTAGTFDGTNTVATLNAPDECLVVYFDSAGNGTIVENVGSVALS